MKRILIFMVIIFLSGAFPGAAETAKKNLLQNGGFETTRGELPDKWLAPGYGRDRKHIKFLLEKNGAAEGEQFLTIEAGKAADARLIQFVKVQPGSIYKFSCKIKTQGIGTKGRGAHFGVLQLPHLPLDVKDTRGKWRQAEFYGKTGPEQREISVVVRLGAPAAFNTGKACFDDFRVEEVQETPRGAKIFNLAPERSPTPRVKKKTAPKSVPVIPVTFLLCACMIFFLAIYYFLLGLYKQPLSTGSAQQKEIPAPGKTLPGLTPSTLFFAFLGAAFVLRLLLAPVIEGYPTDIACFKGWAALAAEKGLPGFYLTDAFVDYPPGYIYILYIIGLLRQLFSLPFDSPVFLVMIKLPAIIADMITAFIIFKLGKKESGFAPASFLSLLYAFNPAVIFDSTIYGQVDSVFVLALLLSLLLLYKNKLPAASVLFVCAVLIKPQALIFSPLFLFAFFSLRSWKTLFISGLWALVTFALMILPFSLHQGVSWVFKLYQKTLASYPFATLNAPNLFALFGANWVKQSETFFIFSYQTWGFIFIGLIVAAAAFFYFRGTASAPYEGPGESIPARPGPENPVVSKPSLNRSKKRGKSGFFFTALFIMAAVFVLTAKMHERYLFPVLALAILSYIYTKKRGFLFLFAGFSLTFLINVAMLLHLMANHDNSGIPGDDLLFRAVSFVNVCLLAYTIKTGVQLYIKRRGQNKNSKAGAAPQPMSPAGAAGKRLQEP